MATDKKIPKWAKFLLGGSAGMTATWFVQPLDLVKNRMQLTDRNGKKFKTSFHVLSSIIKNEGILELYNGLSAGLLRQATYTTTRLGVYTCLLENFTKKDQPLSFPVKALFGMTAGACGALVGTPAELALIRMTGDGHLPREQRRNYKCVVDALIRVIKEEGIAALFRGCTPTVLRAMVVNAAQLATYTQAKQMILATGKLHDGLFCQFCASMGSGLATTIVSMPVDILKTRIQAMKIIDGVPEYSGPIDVCLKLLKKEGVFAFWKGFTPYYMRSGPHTMLTLIFLELHNRAYIELFCEKQD
ncbi:Mitochondrial 2-oxoglutarate/malate carrier protein [Trichostrongylus colubriformis]|uniref:Mitochondrial 2-oxoglutarate/malate carrier protein n=1 Tax=Trichostrongylus colubriformis TaxID=6319 RepID=A0AAN8ENN0_TRICO